MYSLVRFLSKFCAGGGSCEAENGDEIPIRNNSFDARPLLASNSAPTVSKIFESRIYERPSSNTSPLSSLQPLKSSSSTATASPELPTQSAVRTRASSLVFHKPSISTESIFRELPSSKSYASVVKPATSSKAFVEAALSLNLTRTLAAPSNVANQQGKGMYVQVEKGKTHVCAVPKANKDLIKKENVPLSPSTSKLPTQSALKPKASSTKSTLQELPYSESSTSTLKPTIYFKASAEAALPLSPTLTPAGQSNVTKQQGKSIYVLVEKGKTHICATPKASEDLIKKETVPLSTSTSKLPHPFPKATTSSPKHASASDEASSSKLTPVYSIPEAIEYMIKNDKVPDILSKPLSSSTYKDYFAALLYAEDYYIEKWNGFKLVNVSLELHKAESEMEWIQIGECQSGVAQSRNRKRSSKDNHSRQNHKKRNKLFVAFEIDSVPERRPFLLSRDFVFARPSGEQRDPFKGSVNRVKKSTLVLVEFGEDFYSQHHSLCRYDVSFSFNRVCLKRAHHAIAAASDILFQNFIFPDYISRENTPTWPANWCSHELSAEQKSAVHHILSSGGAPPYLVEGPLCASGIASYDSNPNERLSKTGVIVKEAVVQILRSSSTRRVLICAPINKTCDVLMRSLKNEIPDWVMFRANAAFREIDEVPIDILDLSHYEGECFTCPSLKELKKYRVILSTFVTSFRLHNEGIPAGHFSHIFLVDASSASEPETMVALSSFATENTTVVVTGAPRNSSGWIRSDIARKHGLRLSYFQRLSQRKQYKNLDPMFITKLVVES